ncbi:hypothetical protein F4778DRAFT_763187 [Xylariomycetidae sp. FL2044]|nr:hypothetical protein F4778DRAFT_763187 [Xylariomycetidae sp. FL2044]
MAENLPFVTIRSGWQPSDGQSISSSGDSAVRRDRNAAWPPQHRSQRLITSSQYGSSLGDDRVAPSATHDTSRVNYHVKHLPDFAKTLEDSATRAFPNRGNTLRYKKVHAILLHWSCDDLFVLPELDHLERCFGEDYNFETEVFSIPSENAHLDLMLRIGAMIKECESYDTLFIVYYGGHARIDESRQSTWCATRNPDSPWLQWSAIQTLLERSLSDVLILLDCCAGAASATFPNGNSITETISASSWDAIAPDPGRYSFTSALIEVLREWHHSRRTFSAAMLHAEVLARLKHPRPELRANGTHFEARATPVHFMMTANHKAPSIEIAPMPSADMPPSPPVDERGFDYGPQAGRSAGAQEIVGSEPNENTPHVMISLALEEDQQLNVNDWEHWLSSIPALAKYVKIQGVFKSHSTLLLLSLPVMVWDLLPENLACNFVAFIRSNNLAAKGNDERAPIEAEIYVPDDSDARSIRSMGTMLSGTTAYTSNDRPYSIFSAISSGKAPADPIYKIDEVETSSRSDVSHSTSSFSHAPDMSELKRKPQPRQRPSLGGTLMKSASIDYLPKQAHSSQHRSSHTKGAPHASHRPRNRPPLPQSVQARLEEYFHNNPKPDVAVKEFLASNLGIETVDFDLWFSHRREQQEVSNRLQSLKIDDHSHDSATDGAQMVLPGHLNRLLEIFPIGHVVLIDLRSPAEYAKSHIHGAINFRAPASFVLRANMDMIEKALPDDASRSSFTKWYTSKCVVFYDKVVEYSWEAPAADALFQKFKSKGWTGQCFVLKGHYREFSSSFDKYIVGTNTTAKAKEYLASLQGIPWNSQWVDHQRYDEWYKQLESEDKVHTTALVPAVKEERLDAMKRQQKIVAKEFEHVQPKLYRMALERRPDENWAIKGPMVVPLERGITKMQEAAAAGGGSSSTGGRSSSKGPTNLVRSGTPGSDFSSSRRSGYSGGLDKEDYDLLESEDDRGGRGGGRGTSEVPVYDPGYHKEGAGPSSGAGGGRGPAAPGTGGPEHGEPRKKSNFLAKLMKSGRPDPPHR